MINPSKPERQQIQVWNSILLFKVEPQPQTIYGHLPCIKKWTLINCVQCAATALRNALTFISPVQHSQHQSFSSEQYSPSLSTQFTLGQSLSSLPIPKSSYILLNGGEIVTLSTPRQENTLKCKMFLEWMGCREIRCDLCTVQELYVSERLYESKAGQR